MTKPSWAPWLLFGGPRVMCFTGQRTCPYKLLIPLTQHIHSETHCLFPLISSSLLDCQLVPISLISYHKQVLELVHLWVSSPVRTNYGSSGHSCWKHSIVWVFQFTQTPSNEPPSPTQVIHLSFHPSVASLQASLWWYLPYETYCEPCQQTPAVCFCFMTPCIFLPEQ